MDVESFHCGTSKDSAGAEWPFVNHGIRGGATVHPQDLVLPQGQVVSDGASSLDDTHSFNSNYAIKQTYPLTPSMFYGTNSLGSMGQTSHEEAVDTYILSLDQDDTDLERDV